MTKIVMRNCRWPTVAQLQVAYIYKLGLGTKADLSESRKWFEKAAAQGSETAKIYVERLNKM